MSAHLRHTPRRILLLGDTHGSERWLARAARVAAGMGLDGIVQLGDFGYLPDDRWHHRFLAVTERLLADAGVPLWFLRGNHDDADALGRLARTGHVDEMGAVRVSPHIRYIPCGTRWTWGATRFAALGGAFSVNRHELVEGETWWPGELIDPAAVAGIGTEPLDVLLTHEAPLTSHTILDRYAIGSPVDHVCTSQRRLVDDAARATGASVVVHGHHHVRYDEITGSSQIVGLACETWDSMAVLDTTSASVSSVCDVARRRAAAASDDPVLRESQYVQRHLVSAHAS